MNTATHEERTVDTAAHEEVTPTPEEFEAKRLTSILDRIEALGGPSKIEIERLKQNVPGGRLRAFSLDNRRFFIVRGVSGLELAEIQKRIVQNASDPEKETQLQLGAACILWTNATAQRRLTEMDLRSGPAGLPSTITSYVMALSDFASPDELQICSVEL